MPSMHIPRLFLEAIMCASLMFVLSVYVAINCTQIKVVSRFIIMVTLVAVSPFMAFCFVSIPDMHSAYFRKNYYPLTVLVASAYNSDF